MVQQRCLFSRSTLFISACILGICAVTPATGQPPAARPPDFRSPVVSPDHTITFKILAPKASTVRLNAGDIPFDKVKGGAMHKDKDGIWELTTDPVMPGAYRYTFQVDGVSTLDPKNGATTESVGNAWSLTAVPGSELMDTRQVPHGAVAVITYHSSSLGFDRRMHIYTPPGYEKGSGKYPVFYLLHGAGDTDDAWTSVGRASFIFDNLSAAGKAKPMIVVMPAGHTRAFGQGSPLPGPDEFTRDFVGDVMPYVESHYRTKNDRADRAIAGLSMGGFQTLNAMATKPEAFAYVGVYSSGLFGIVPSGQAASPAATPRADFPWEVEHRTVLQSPETKKGLKLFWFGIGKEDFLFATNTATVAMYKKYGFDVIYHESAGGHTWLNWRDYLIDFTPRLFR